MVFFVRSFIADYDGKIQKYFSALKSANISFHYVGWARAGADKKDSENETFFYKDAPLGGGIKNFYNLFLWNIFLFFTLVKNRKKINIVHAIDFDSALISFIFCRLFGKKFIFDIYDKYTDVRVFPKILISIIDKLEIALIKKANFCILADSNRYGQHGLSPSLSNIIVLENVPSVSSISNDALNEIVSDIHIGYFGVLEPNNRGLEDLVLAVKKHSNVVLHVVGYGPLADFMQENSKDNLNIKFYGSKTAQEGLQIMKNMHILVGMYYRTVKNHLFAAPNKYYEHLMLARPLLTTEGTPPGFKVISYDTGWGVKEGQECLCKWLESLSDHDEIIKKSNNAGELWREKYVNYYLDCYEGLYIRKIMSLIN